MVPVPKKPDVVPEILHLDRTMFILEGVVQSRSDAERQYRPRIVLQANHLCTCADSIMGGNICDHLKVLLQNLSKEELIEFISDAQTIPDPVVPEEED